MTSRLGPFPLIPAVLLLGGVLAGCHGEPTGPAGRAARLVLVEPPPDSVAAGSGTAAAFRVRAMDGGDEPVEGLRLRLLALAGGGAVEPPSGVTGPEGELSASYRPGEAVGPARIRIDAPGAHEVAPLILDIRQTPETRIRIERMDGDGQEAEPGTQLPRPLRVTALGLDGTPAAGVRLTWRLAEGPGGGRLEPLSLRTDESGRAAALLTLGDEPGVHTVRVHGAGGVAGDTASFTARAVADLAVDFRIDSVSPLPLEPGAPAVVRGSGLPAVADAEVRVDGRVAEILDGSSSRIRIRVPPAEGCRPDRRSGIRVLSGDRTSNGLMAPLRGAGVRLDGPAGRIRTFGPEGARCLQLPAGDGIRSYRLAVHSVARSGAGATAVDLATRAGPGTEASSADAPPARRAGATRRGGGAAGRGDLGARWDGPGARRTPGVRPGGRIAPLLQERARRELRRRSARPASPGDGAGRTPRPPVGAAVPAEGDLLRLRFAVAPDLSVSCADTSRSVTARVRAVRPSVVLAEDTAGAGGFAAADHDLLAGEFQGLVFPTDTAYFGSPTDLDGNGRVVVLFTHRVNELTPRGAEAAVGGFFLPLDLAESGDGDEAGVPGPGGETCAASNEAEVLYLPVPDPQGVHGPPFSRAEARRNARAIVAHELMHLLSSGQRVVIREGGFTALEEVWLAEALSHLAEEVVGFAFRGSSPGEGLDFGDFAGSREGLEAFNTFHLQNFGRLQLFLLDPARAPALALADPGGTAGLQMRGYGWLLVRWLADRFADPGSEADFVRRLSTGGPSVLAGIENVTSATGTEWTALLEDFALVPLLEGRELPAADAASSLRASRARLSTWELREAYGGLSKNPGSRVLFPLGYPLAPGELAFRDDRIPVELRAGAARYLSLTAAGSSPALALGLGDAAGAALPSDAPVRLTVVRLR